MIESIPGGQLASVNINTELHSPRGPSFRKQEILMCRSKTHLISVRELNKVILKVDKFDIFLISIFWFRWTVRRDEKCLMCCWREVAAAK